MGAQRSPIGIRSFARAGLLLASAGSLFASAGSLFVFDPAVYLSLAVELAVFAGLSPEWDGYWLVPLRRLKVRLTRPLRGTPEQVPLAVTIAQLHRSDAYRRLSRLIISDVREHWDDGRWRIICYTARFRGDEVSAVFAVPRRRFEPDAVRAARVDESTGVTVFSLDPGSRDL